MLQSPSKDRSQTAFTAGHPTLASPVARNGLRFWLAFAWTFAIVALCLLPKRSLPIHEDRSSLLRIPHLDKVVHACVFAGFAWLWMGVRGPSTRTLALRVTAVALLLALGTELGQELPVVNRDGDVLDGLADMSGAVIGIAVGLRQRRKTLILVGLVFAASGLPTRLQAGDDVQKSPVTRVLRPGDPAMRSGDEIVVCGRMFHTTTPVVLWTDAGGYDAYRVERHFGPFDKANEPPNGTDAVKTPNRYGSRQRLLPEPERIRIRAEGWDLPTLQRLVDQFVIHFDARGTSRRCYEVLHDLRGLSVHFMLDLDGTLYQTLDLKESARHATIANARSIGIEVANIGAYAVGTSNPISNWYQPLPGGGVQIRLPATDGEPKSLLSIDLRPARPNLIVGEIQGKQLEQYDFTPPQYEALIKLTASLARVFPKIKLDYPRDPEGRLLTKKLSPAEYARYQGVLGHYHVQLDKVDPGPAFEWDRVIDGARRLLATASTPEPGR